MVQIYNTESENVSIRSYYYWIWNNVRNECIWSSRPDLLGKLIHCDFPHEPNQQPFISIEVGPTLQPKGIPEPED